jgi:L-fuconate dehydratase
MPMVTGFEVVPTQLPGVDTTPASRAVGAVVVTLATDSPERTAGQGLVVCPVPFTRVVASLAATIAPAVVGVGLGELAQQPAEAWAALRRRPEFRLVERESGVARLARAVVVDAIWDVAARHAGLPLWQLLAGLSPEQLAGCADLRQVDDALTASEAVDMLARRVPGKRQRESQLRRDGYPAQLVLSDTISDTALRRRMDEAVAAGFRLLLAVLPTDLDAAISRARLVARGVSDEVTVAVDVTSQTSRVAIRSLLEPLGRLGVAWLIEPAGEDDPVATAAVRTASGHVLVAAGVGSAGCVAAKQFLRLDAVDAFRCDPVRLGGIDEALTVLLLAARYRVPVWPSGTGPGAFERLAHLAAVDHIAIGASLDRRMGPYSPGQPVVLSEPTAPVRGRFPLPQAPGSGVRVRPDVLRAAGSASTPVSAAVGGSASDPN